jgi:hypothetical protein
VYPNLLKVLNAVYIATWKERHNDSREQSTNQGPHNDLNYSQEVSEEKESK